MSDCDKNRSSDVNDNFPDNIDRRQVLKGLTASAIGIGGLSWSDTLQTAKATTQTSGSTIGPTLIESDEEAGFNFPYMFYAPETVREKPLVVETVNSGGCDDDFQVDLDAAQRTVENGPARQISDSLQVPLIVPVFANPCEGEFYHRFVQTLDTETMRIEEGKFERIDLQMIQMIEDARSRLSNEGYDIPTEVMLNGFSASGNFMNNFAILHPERVASVTAGAINGMAILPRESIDGQQTNFMIGVADLEDLIGEEFNEEAWQEVPQFCYMGETESPPQDDTLPYRDVWSEEQASKARDIYGNDMQTDRMTFSEWEYHKAGALTRFEIYDGIGHTYNREIIKDVIEFHRRHNGISKGASSEPGEASFATEPQAGETSIEVSYKWPTGASERRAILSVVPDGESKYWERRIRLATVMQGDEQTATFDLSADREGVPFESGDELKLWLIPEGNQTPRRATSIQTVTIGGESTTLSASSCDENLEHPDIEIGFTERPTAGDQDVGVSYDIGDGFGERARTRLFPETGGGRWGLGLDRIDLGQSGQVTYSIDTTLKLGETVELRVFPVSWSQLDDVEATNCAVVSGIQFAEVPTGGASGVTVEYLYPDDANADANLELTIGSETVDTVRGISPGTFESYTFSVDGFDGGLPGEVEVQATLRPVGSTDPIDSAVYQTRQADAGTVALAKQPGDGDQSVTLEYALDSEADVGRFAALRMYHAESSSWGIYLGDVTRGDEGVDSFDIITDEPGVPLTEGTELEVALVAGDDPYRTSPLSTASITVGAESGGQQETQPLQVRLMEPVEGATVSAAEDLSVTVEVVNENDVPVEATLTVTVGESSLEKTVVADEQDKEEVNVTVSADALSGGEELTLVVSGENLASTVDRAIVVEESLDSASKSEDSTDGDAEGKRGEDEDTQGTNVGTPGFGLVEAISGLGGVGYMIKNRLQSDDATDKTDS